MESKTFIKLLRKIIREEVSKAVKSALNESNSHVSSNLDLKSVVQETSAPKKFTKKKFTKNKMINDLLNETASAPVNQELTDWSTMNFKSEMARSYERPTTNVRPLATQGIDGEAINMNNEGVAATVNAMTKDYSALMKAIDKKKGR